MRRVTVWASVRAAVSSTTEAFGRYLLVNLLWLLVAAATAVAGSLFPPAYAVGVALVPVSCGLLGMVGHTVRKDFPNRRHFREGAARRPLAHLGLGAVQAALLAAAVVNLGVGMGGASLLSALITVIAAYIGLLTVMFGVTAWPLLMDPDRGGKSFRAVLRMAVALVLARPVRTAVVAVIEMVFLFAVAQTPLLGLLLPSFGALVAAYFVLPAADVLERHGTLSIRRSAQRHG